jgi:hypothetical protein
MSGIDTVREHILSVTGSHHGIALGAAVYSPQDQPMGANYLMVQSITQATIFTLDGSTPSATNGFVLLTTQSPVLIGMGTSVIPKFLRAASGAILQYQWLE